MLILKIRRRLALVAILIVQKLRIAWYFLLSTNRVSGHPVLHQPLQAAGAGVISFESSVRLGVFPSPGFLDSYAYIEARSPNAMVILGAGTWVNNGFRCIAEHSSIRIGRGCLIGANVEILDSDFHGIAPAERGISKPEWAAPVVVEDNVFIGSNVRILKGVRIGAGAVIANSAVVIADIPPMVVAAGIPAKVIRPIA
ncbi:acyltransferase [Thermomonas alba]|uniref:acyltransferase n=1 Tax=Thermomonas alba TaxID=2888525 RepID=UPI001F038C84|nr:acyltransferase [Thermomonas alba]